MSKQAILMVVDVGHSMDEAFSEGSSRAKIALECCKLTLQQKLFNNSSHQLGLVLFGDSQTDDGNSLLLQEIEKPRVDFVRKIQQLSEARFDSPRAGGDIFSSINYSLGLITDHCGKKKYNKRMFLFTNGMGITDFDHQDVKTLANKMMNSGVKLNIIPIDFMVSYNSEDNELEGEMFLESVQERNAQLLMKFKELSPENVQIFPASLAIQLYRKFRKRDTNPVARYKGVMEIAPGLEIDVCTYKAIRRYDASVPFEPAISQKQVIIETNYVVQGDEAGKIVDSENIINAFNYGPQLVPISSILEAGSKIFEEKNLRFLGFVEKSKIPRHCLMSQVDIVIPADNQAGRKLFTAFIYSMISLNKYAIARYVSRNQKNGVSPKMVVLIPYRSAEREMFYLIELPTVEDVRDYPFNSLKKSTERQQEIVKGLIDKMMLYHKVDDDLQEEVKVENTFNPTRQYFFQTLFYRALNEDSMEIPPLDPVIKKYLSPEVETYQSSGNVIKEVKKEFKLVKKINLEQKKNKSKSLMWKDIIGEISKGESDSTGMVSQQAEQAEFVKPALKFSAEDEDDDIKFNPSNPINSFKKMISFNKKDLVGEGLKFMTNYILQRLAYSITNQAYKHIGQCAIEMRKACLSQQQHDHWDDWFTSLEQSNPKFFDYLRGEGLGLIKGSNIQIFKPVELHEEIIEEVIIDLD